MPALAFFVELRLRRELFEIVDQVLHVLASVLLVPKASAHNSIQCGRLCL